jgi:hypothetical protein
MNFILSPSAFILCALLPLQLAAGGLDIVAARAANVNLKTLLQQDLPEAIDIGFSRPLKRTIRMGIEWNHVDLTTDTAQEPA